MLKRTEPVVGRRVLCPDRPVHSQNAAMAAGPVAPARKPRQSGIRSAANRVQPTSRWAKGYASNRYRAWFTGMAPRTGHALPGVMLDEPSNGQYFGLVAAPVFSETVQQTCAFQGVTPDMGAKPQIVIEAAEESF